MKVGIVCDNHKETEYVERLNKAGLTELEITDLGKHCKTITVTLATSDKKALVSKIVSDTEAFFSKPAKHKYA